MKKELVKKKKRNMMIRTTLCKLTWTHHNHIKENTAIIEEEDKGDVPIGEEEVSDDMEAFKEGTSAKTKIKCTSLKSHASDVINKVILLMSVPIGYSNYKKQ